LRAIRQRDNALSGAGDLHKLGSDYAWYHVDKDGRLSDDKLYNDFSKAAEFDRRSRIYGASAELLWIHHPVETPQGLTWWLSCLDGSGQKRVCELHRSTILVVGDDRGIWALAKCGKHSELHIISRHGIFKKIESDDATRIPLGSQMVSDGDSGVFVMFAQNTLMSSAQHTPKTPQTQKKGFSPSPSSSKHESSPDSKLQFWRAKKKSDTFTKTSILWDILNHPATNDYDELRLIGNQAMPKTFDSLRASPATSTTASSSPRT
jgi:hypothetical protein